MRRPRGRRRVGPPVEQPFKEASLNCGCGAFDPPMRVERRSERRGHCLRGIQPEGPGACRTGPEHVAPITGYGAKAPVGFPCWMSMGNSCTAISGRNGRSGAREDAHRQRKLALELTHGADPRAPAPSIARVKDSIPDSARWSESERATEGNFLPQSEGLGEVDCALLRARRRG